MTYLADTSMIVRLRHGQALEPRWVDAVQAGLVGVCSAVEGELVRAVGSKTDFDQLRRTLRGLFVWHPMPEHVWRFVENTQDELVVKGRHAGPSVVDLLVAGTAQAWNLTVLHVDADFETIATVTELRTQRADKPGP